MGLTISEWILIVDGMTEKEVEMANQKTKKLNRPKKYYTVTMTFDQWVDINQELQSKAMFLGGVTKLTRSERVLLIFTNDIMFGSGNAKKETKH
jgi:hypothetical protein